MMKTLFTILFVCLVKVSSLAQEAQPIKWAFYSKQNPDKSYTIFAKATLEEGWHVFALDPGGDGLLIPTQFSLSDSKTLKAKGNVTVEGELIQAKMEGIGDVNYYEKEVVFMQQVIANGAKKVSGKVSFQICNEKMCLPPDEINFTLEL